MFNSILNAILDISTSFFSIISVVSVFGYKLKANCHIALCIHFKITSCSHSSSYFMNIRYRRRRHSTIIGRVQAVNVEEKRHNQKNAVNSKFNFDVFRV